MILEVMCQVSRIIYERWSDELGRTTRLWRRAHEIEETKRQARKCGKRIHGVHWVLGTFSMPRILRGEGNGTPLQYSCLENPMDGGNW